MKNTFLIFILLLFSTKTIASNEIQVFVKGGNKQTSIMETSVAAKKVPYSENCTPENPEVIAKYSDTLTIPELKQFKCNGSKPYMEIGTFNQTYEPFGASFAYSTEIIKKYKAYHKQSLFNSPIEISFMSYPKLSANANWSESKKRLTIYSGSEQDKIYAPTEKSIIYHEIGHAVSKMDPTKPDTDDIAVDEAFADIFAVFFNNIDTVESKDIEWTIGRGYSRQLSAIRYVDNPRLDGSVENIKDIKSGMNAYQRGGFIRKMFFNLYTNLTKTGLSKKKSLEYSYMLFFKANERHWKDGMSFDDLGLSLYKVFSNDYSSIYNQTILLNAISSVGLTPTVKYTYHNKGGFTGRLRITYYDEKGQLQTQYTNVIPVAQKTSVNIPAAFSASATIFAQYHTSVYLKDFKTLFPDRFQNACVNTWGTIFSPQAKIGDASCNF